MDLNIRPVTPEIMRERGAQAFDDGRTVDDHGMNPCAPAIADWQFGYRQREREVREDRAWAARELMGCPP